MERCGIVCGEILVVEPSPVAFGVAGKKPAKQAGFHNLNHTGRGHDLAEREEPGTMTLKPLSKNQSQISCTYV